MSDIDNPSYTGINQDEPINHIADLNTYWTYTYINNNHFYPLVPKPYYNFYQRFVRQWLYWYDGYVPYIHNSRSGIFSTRLALTLAKTLASKINGGTLMYDSLSETLKDYSFKGQKYNAVSFIKEWADDNNLSNKMDTIVELALAGGDTLLTLNKTSKQELWLDYSRKDQYWVDLDFRGNVIKSLKLIYTYVKGIREHGELKSEDYYYLLEEREYVNEVPMITYYVKKGTGNVTQNKPIDIERVQRVDYKDLPKQIRENIYKDYGLHDLGKQRLLGLPSLGVYLLKNTEGVSFLPQLPYGESIFSNLISYLITYDYYYSAFNTDMYTGRARLIMPDHMQNPNQDSDTQGFNTGLDSFLYAKVSYVDAQDQKPILMQFDIRAENWNSIRNQLLQSIAMQIGVDQRSIANFTDMSIERPTAREISSDEDKTVLWVENRRAIIKNVLNKLLNDVLDFYNFDEKITVRFSRAGLSNFTTTVSNVTVLKQNDLIDELTALQMIFVDKNDVEIKRIYDAIQKEKKEKQELEQKKKESDTFKKETDGMNNDVSHVKKE